MNGVDEFLQFLSLRLQQQTGFLVPSAQVDVHVFPVISLLLIIVHGDRLIAGLLTGLLAQLQGDEEQKATERSREFPEQTINAW